MSTGKNNNKNKNLDDFKKLEESKNPNIAAQLNDAADLEQEEIEETEQEQLPKVKSLKKEYNIIEGYRVLKRFELPFQGKFYPPNWEFAYRCPTTEEVANFSTIVENDQPRIINAITELVRKCYKVIDRVKQQEVPSGSINDGERLFFFLKLREFYLHDSPIQYVTISQEYNEPVTINFVADSLVYKMPNEKLFELFDGRMFTFDNVPGTDETIKFLIPTLDLGSRIFRYVTKKYSEAQKENTDSLKDKDAFDKNFLFLAPYLFETGNETMESLKVKYNQIKKNDKLLDGYIQIINQLKIDNQEKIKYTYKESEEEALMKFPGGWKHIFVDKNAFGGVFN